MSDDDPFEGHFLRGQQFSPSKAEIGCVFGRANNPSGVNARKLLCDNPADFYVAFTDATGRTWTGMFATPFCTKHAAELLVNGPQEPGWRNGQVHSVVRRGSLKPGAAYEQGNNE